MRNNDNDYQLRGQRRGEFVKAKVFLLMIPFVCASAGTLSGQVDCTTSTKLACQFPVSAQVLVQHTIGYSKSSAASDPAYQGANAVAGPINAAIATQLTQLPIPSASLGVVMLHEKGSDVPTPFDNLGPVLIDRPDTVGKGHIFLGFSYQRFHFNHLNGVSLSALPANFKYSQTSSTNVNDIQTFYGSESNNVDFTLDQYVGILTVGLNKKTDVSVIVPTNNVKLNATASNFAAFVYDSYAQAYTNLTPTSNTPVTSSGTASGIGDVTVTLKHLFLGGDGSRAAIAGGGTFRVPTGDELNYMGSGTIGGSAFGLFEYRARLAPHAKIAYQWNGQSQLMDLQKAKSTSLPGGMQYAFGADYRWVRALTLSADVLGSQFVNTPSFTLSTAQVCPATTTGGTCITPPTATGISQNFTSVITAKNTYSTANVSAGLKWAPIRHVILYGNVMVQMNNVGFKSDPVPQVGIAFKK